ncbi:unnamed protein product, partial [marine sediment metagenome]
IVSTFLSLVLTIMDLSLQSNLNLAIFLLYITILSLFHVRKG